MKLFYNACVHSVISFSLICWYSNLAIKDKKNYLGRIVKTASKLTGIQSISLDNAHPVYAVVIWLSC